MNENQYIERIRGLEEELEEANSELGRITAAYQKIINQDEDLKKTVEEIIRIQTRLEKAEKFILNTVVYNNEERGNT